MTVPQRRIVCEPVHNAQLGRYRGGDSVLRQLRRGVLQLLLGVHLSIGEFFFVVLCGSTTGLV